MSITKIFYGNFSVRVSYSMNVPIKELRWKIDGRGSLEQVLCVPTARAILNCIFFDVFVKYGIKLSSLSFNLNRYHSI